MLLTLARGLRIQISMSLPFNNFIYIFQMIELLRELESARASLFPLVRIHHKYFSVFLFLIDWRVFDEVWCVRSVLGFQTWSEHRIPHFFRIVFLFWDGWRKRFHGVSSKACVSLVRNYHLHLLRCLRLETIFHHQMRSAKKKTNDY